jgi:hypothetical protein
MASTWWLLPSDLDVSRETHLVLVDAQVQIVICSNHVPLPPA